MLCKDVLNIINDYSSSIRTSVKYESVLWELEYDCWYELDEGRSTSTFYYNNRKKNTVSKRHIYLHLDKTIETNNFLERVNLRKKKVRFIRN